MDDIFKKSYIHKKFFDNDDRKNSKFFLAIDTTSNTKVVE